MAGVDIVHVPYKGGGPAMQDVITGHVKIMFSSLIQTTPFIKSGQLIALGTGGAKRNPVLPDVPTIAEAGVPGYVADNWWGSPRPPDLPPAIVDQLYKASQAALKAAGAAGAFDARARLRSHDLGRIRRIHQIRNRQMGAGGQGRQHQGAIVH